MTGESPFVPDTLPCRCSVVFRPMRFASLPSWLLTAIDNSAWILEEIPRIRGDGADRTATVSYRGLLNRCIQLSLNRPNTSQTRQRDESQVRLTLPFGECPPRSRVGLVWPLCNTTAGRANKTAGGSA